MLVQLLSTTKFQCLPLQISEASLWTGISLHFSSKLKIHLILLFSVEEWLLLWMLRSDFHFINFVFNNSVQSSVFLSGLYYAFLWEENLTQHSSVVVFFRTKATNHILQLGVHIFSVLMFTSKLFACLSIPTQLDVNCNLWCYLHTVVS